MDFNSQDFGSCFSEPITGVKIHPSIEVFHSGSAAILFKDDNDKVLSAINLYPSLHTRTVQKTVKNTTVDTEVEYIRLENNSFGKQELVMKACKFINDKLRNSQDPSYKPAKDEVMIPEDVIEKMWDSARRQAAYKKNKKAQPVGNKPVGGSAS